MTGATGHTRTPGIRSALTVRAKHLRQGLEASLVGVWLERLIELQFIDRAVALAAKAFVALVPVVVAVAALAPDSVRAAMTGTLQRRMGLSGPSLELVRAGFASEPGISTSTGFVGGLLLLFYAMSFTRALQRVYLSAWRQPPETARRAAFKGLAWLVVLMVMLWIAGVLHDALTDRPPGWALFLLLAFAALSTFWWTTAFLSLRGHVRWRVLLPSSLLTAVGLLLYGAAASVWMPRSVEANEAQFGLFGVSMTIVSWFVGAALILVGATALGPVLAQDGGWLGRLIRGRGGTIYR